MTKNKNKFKCGDIIKDGNEVYMFIVRYMPEVYELYIMNRPEQLMGYSSSTIDRNCELVSGT